MNYAAFAIPVPELIKLRDNLYQTGNITDSGVKEVNALITQYTGFDAEEVKA